MLEGRRGQMGRVEGGEEEGGRQEAGGADGGGRAECRDAEGASLGMRSLLRVDGHEIIEELVLAAGVAAAEAAWTQVAGNRPRGAVSEDDDRSSAGPSARCQAPRAEDVDHRRIARKNSSAVRRAGEELRVLELSRDLRR